MSDKRIDDFLFEVGSLDHEVSLIESRRREIERTLELATNIIKPFIGADPRRSFDLKRILKPNLPALQLTYRVSNERLDRNTYKDEIESPSLVFQSTFSGKLTIFIQLPKLSSEVVEKDKQYMILYGSLAPSEVKEELIINSLFAFPGHVSEWFKNHI